MSATDSTQYEEILIESTVDKNRTIDLRQGVQSVDYYEDVFSPTITAKILVSTTGSVIDNTGVYLGLPLRGGERLSMKLQGNTDSNPGLDFSGNNSLYVSGISNVIRDSKQETFVLNLCSREAITNETSRVPIRFPTSSPISVSAEEIIKKYLVTNKELFIDKTSNKYGFIGNMKKPFTLLTWLASKGVPETTDGTAGYFFYETQDGYCFKSVDSLIAQESSGVYTSVETVDRDRNQDFQILNHVTTRNNNLLEKLRLGQFSTQRSYFNPLTFDYTAPDKGLFKLEDYAGKSKNLGRSFGMPPINEGSETTLGDIPSRLVTGIVDIGTLEDGVSYEENADPFKYQSQAIMRYNIMFTQTMTITVPSNTNLRAGNIIQCLFPATTTASDNIKFDGEISGLYMIKELCHHFDAEGSYTSLKLIRDTFGQYGKNNK
jgi:hypothetical protein|tara:strand:+ start:477 stop:1775 length:1299 start_codon:yes stop_codon:yes gene_type:complete